MKPLYSERQLKKLYADYPDVVTLKQFREMLGGISDGIARKLMQGDHVEHFVVNGTYYIPKKFVIEYVTSPHYYMLQMKLKHRISIPDFWNENQKGKK